MFDNYVISYAQNREDIILSAFFDKDEKGFYVDIGANDPMHESVTKYFYDRGWSGINVEPLPNYFKKLNEDRPRDINLQVAISDRAGEATINYYPNGDGLSTLSQKMKDEYANSNDAVVAKVEYINVRTQRLEKVLSEYAKDQQISFLKIDVEGLEYQVLISNNWTKFRPQVICIEANHIDQDWHYLLLDQEYSRVFFDGVNEYYSDNNSDKFSKFDYVHGVIYKEPIVNFRLIKDAKIMEEKLANLTSLNESLGIEVIETSKELSYIQSRNQALINEIDALTPLRKHFKRQVKIRLVNLDQKITNRLNYTKEYTPATINEKYDKNTIKRYDYQNFKVYNEKTTFNIWFRSYIIGKRIIKKIYKMVWI